MAYDKRMRRFNVHEAKTHFSKLLERVEAGEEIEICRNGEPVAKVVRCADAEETARLRRGAFGLWKDEIWISKDFDEPLPEEFFIGESGGGAEGLDPADRGR